MTDDLATAMRRALQKTCASDPRGATAVIQAALSGELSPREESGPGAATNATHTLPLGALARLDFSSLPGLSSVGDSITLPGMTNLSPHSLLGRISKGAETARAPVPEGARVEARRHTDPAGARHYRLFVPSPRESGFEGLVVMLHGCTQSPEDFALGTRMDLAAEQAGFVVAYPGQTGQHNLQSCWNWFRPEDQERGGGEPEVLATLAAAVADEFDLSGRVFVAGLSAGGAMAAVLAETHPDVFAAAGIHSGLPAGSAQDVPSAFAAMRGPGRGGRAPAIPVIVFHGTADSTVSVENARSLVPGSGIETRHQGGGRSWSRMATSAGSELWLVDGGGHAWFGGDASGTYSDPSGPDASPEMLRFFRQIESTQ